MSIPKDGYYIAKVQLDTGGEHQCYVRVKNGKLHDEEGEELLSEACSGFSEVHTTLMVRVWPEDAAMELEALRTANAGLVEKAASDLAIKEARRLEQEVECLHIENLNLRRANERLRRQVASFIDYLTGARAQKLAQQGKDLL